MRKRQFLAEIELERPAQAEKGNARSGYRYAHSRQLIYRSQRYPSRPRQRSVML
jgi:hypothetical protein